MATPELHKRAAELARQAASAVDREAFVRERCGGDVELETLVRRALELESQQTLVTGPAPASGSPSGSSSAPSVDVSAPSASPRGRRIGAYTLLDLLGEGGMGAVYLAEQDRPRRVVALKLVRPGLLTPRMLQRFELESELLARLQHPGIAQIYEAGTASTPDGPQPYFAMEYVRGPTLTEFVRQRGLQHRQIVQLMIRVCQAVQHAHQKGVIHRDLKPGNILVHTGDGGDASAQPKILDFGIARSSLEQAPGQTEAGQLVGTVPYMSPEQISPGPGGIDTRSDVYTLGVIVYELLTGELPHPVTGSTLADAARTICHDEPRPIGRLDRSLRGDIQTIVGKALEKDRSRRYASAGELAADLQRYLNDEPVLAQPPSRVYQLRKFAARNRVLVGGACAVVAALVLGIVGVSVQAARAEAARAAAREQADVAEAANRFLSEMLGAVNPERDNDREVTVREMLDRAAERLKTESPRSSADQRVAMQIESTLSTTYRALGRAEDSLEHAQRAQTLADSLLVPSDLGRIDARRNVAMALTELARLDEAQKLTEECVRALLAAQGPDGHEYWRARAELGRVLLESGKFEAAERELRASVERMRALLGERENDTVIALDHWGLSLQRLGRFEEAERVEREGLRIREEVFGPDSLVTAFSLNNLANISQRLGRDQEALDLLNRVVQIRTRKLDADHPSLLVALTNLGVAYAGAKQLEPARETLERVLALQEKKLGEAHPKTLSTMGNLAFVLEDLGRLEDAEHMFERAVRIRDGLKTTDQDGLGQMNNLAMLYQKRGKLEQAAALYDRLLPACEAQLPAGHYLTAIFRSNAGDCLAQMGRYERAERELLSSQRALEAFFKPGHPRIEKGRQRLAKLYTLWNKPDEAAKYAPQETASPASTPAK